MNVLSNLSLMAVDAEHSWGHGGWWPWGPVFFGFWVLLIAAIAATIWLVARRGAQYQAVTAERTGIDQARAILAERFARGEISAEEYDERLTHLS